MKDIEKFRDGLFNMRTRTLWDILNLYLTQKYAKNRLLTVRVSVARGLNNTRYETLYDKIVLANQRDTVLYSNTEQNFLCNFQQLKVNEIRSIVYCVIFRDKIEVFEVSADNISSVPNIYYNQHRDNSNESQFAVKRGNIDWHRANTKIADLSYTDLCDFTYGIRL